MNYASAFVLGTIFALSSATAQDIQNDAFAIDRVEGMQSEILEGMQTAVDIQQDLRPELMFDWNAFASDAATDANYRAGTVAINRHDYEAAIASMQRVVAAKAHLADAALYWKAYAQLKLGRAHDALSTLADLRHQFRQSSWLNDAGALDAEARSQIGKPVSPDAAGDEDLKLLAINGLMNSDPSRATPLIEKLVVDPNNAPQLRARALFVLARSPSPDARRTVTRMATGGANPDLQVRALQYLAATGAKENGALFANVYRQSPETEVKRAALNALFINKDSSDLLTIAKNEANPALQREAVHFVGMTAGTSSLVALYQSSASVSLKRDVINSLFSQGAAKELVDIAKHEKNPQLKRDVVECLAGMKNQVASDYLLELLK